MFKSCRCGAGGKDIKSVVRQKGCPLQRSGVGKHICQNAAHTTLEKSYGDCLLTALARKELSHSGDCLGGQFLLREVAAAGDEAEGDVGEHSLVAVRVIGR